MNPQKNNSGMLEARTYSIINPIIPDPYQFSSEEDIAATFRKQREERENLAKKLKEMSYTLRKFEKYKQKLEKIRGEEITDNLAYRVLRRNAYGTFPKKSKSYKIKLLL